MLSALWLKDTAERTIRTFVQTWLGIMIASGAFDFSVSAVRGAAAAGLASAGAVLMAALSTLNGNTGAGVAVSAVENSDAPDDGGAVNWIAVAAIAIIVLVVVVLIASYDFSATEK